MTDVMTPTMLAKRWGCHDATIRRMIKRGELPAFRSGGKLLRIRLKDIEAHEKGECTQTGNSSATKENGKPTDEKTISLSAARSARQTG